MSKGQKVKEFFNKHKKEFALVAGTAIVVGGGVALYLLNGKPGELRKIVKSYSDDMRGDLIKFANEGTYVYTASPNSPKTMDEIGTCIDAIKTCATEEGRLNSLVTGMVVFIKEQ